MVMPSGPLQVVPDIDDQLNEHNNKAPPSLLTPGTPLLSAVSPLSAGKNCTLLSANFCIITARIRSMGEVMFNVFVCSQGGGGSAF